MNIQKLYFTILLTLLTCFNSLSAFYYYICFPDDTIETGRLWPGYDFTSRQTVGYYKNSLVRRYKNRFPNLTSENIRVYRDYGSFKLEIAKNDGQLFRTRNGEEVTAIFIIIGKHNVSNIKGEVRVKTLLKEKDIPLDLDSNMTIHEIKKLYLRSKNRQEFYIDNISTLEDLLSSEKLRSYQLVYSGSTVSPETIFAEIEKPDLLQTSFLPLHIITISPITLTIKDKVNGYADIIFEDYNAKVQMKSLKEGYAKKIGVSPEKVTFFRDESDESPIPEETIISESGITDGGIIYAHIEFAPSCTITNLDTGHSITLENINLYATVKSLKQKYADEDYNDYIFYFQGNELLDNNNNVTLESLGIENNSKLSVKKKQQKATLSYTQAGIIAFLATSAGFLVQKLYNKLYKKRKEGVLKNRSVLKKGLADK